MKARRKSIKKRRATASILKVVREIVRLRKQDQKEREQHETCSRYI